MSRSAKILALVPAALMVVGCEDTVTNTTTASETQAYTDTKATGTITLVVRDQLTGTMLSGVKATLLGTGTASVVSDSSGITQFASVVPGTRLVRLEKAGYASRIVSASLYDGNSEVPRVHDFTDEVTLPRLGASVTGKVYFSDKLGNHNVDSGAVVYLQYAGEGWVNGLFSTVTDKDGAYRFDSLPEDIRVNLTVRSHKLALGVYAADGGTSISGLKAGEIRNLENINLSIDAEAFSLLTTTIDAIPETETVTVNFSGAVDTVALRKDDLTVTAGGQDVAIVPTWSNGNKTLTLKPFSGKWITGSNRIEISVKSALGQSISETLTFNAGTVSALPAAVTSLHSKAMILGKEKIDTVDGNTGSVTFTWNKATGADGYTLYKKATKDNAFTKVGGTSDAKDTVTTITSGDMFDKGDTVSFVVVSFNAKGYSAVESAAKLTLTDLIAPKLLADPGDFVVPADVNNSASTKDSIKTDAMVFNFSEPVDTLGRPVFTIANNINAGVKKANDDSLKVIWEWVSRTQGKATLVVMPKYDATGMDVDISADITMIKDENKLTAVSPKAEYLIFRAKQPVAPAPAPATP